MNGRFVLLPAVSLLLSTPAAWATFQNATARAATASFTASSLTAPVLGTVQECTVSNTVTVAWTVSPTSFVTGQVAEVSTSSTFASVYASASVANNTTTTASIAVATAALTTYYVRVRATYQSWSGISAMPAAPATVC